jgi:hypothetical protein
MSRVNLGRFCLAMLLSGPALPTSAEELMFTSVQEMDKQQYQVQIFGGYQAAPEQWPATFTFFTDAGACTATAIGPQALLTAAHCVKNTQRGKIKAGSLIAEVLCTHHEDYPTQTSADFSLCHLSKPLPSKGSGFERLNTDSSLPALNDEILLIGFGCNRKGGKNREFGMLFEGNATVDKLPTEHDLYVRTKGAAVCFGDSGGGAYIQTKSGRRLFAVNSRGDISTYSWLSSTAGKSFVNWATKWAKANKAPICGLDEMPGDCR